MGKKFIIAVDLGGTNLKIALLDSSCRIKLKKVLTTQSFSKKDDLIRAIVNAVSGILKVKKLKRSSISGVGLGVPGPVDHKNGIVHFFPNIRGWHEVRLKQMLEKKLALPVLVDNDAKLMCLAEYALGNARKSVNALCITLGTGIGGGLIVGGKLFRGLDNSAGEFGHLPINEPGPHCNCGGTACIESYIGNKRLIKEAAKLFKRSMSLEEISVLAGRGNKKAINFWKVAGIRLGRALVAVVNLLNLDCIVIGGGVASAGEVLLKHVRGTVKKDAMPVQARRVKIMRAKLGNDAGIIGAAIMVKCERKI